MVSRYEPDRFIIEFVRFTPGEMIVKIAIRLSENGAGRTAAFIAYTYTGLTEAKHRFIAEQMPVEFQQSMAWWERAMNHYLESGATLRHRGKP